MKKIVLLTFVLAIALVGCSQQNLSEQEELLINENEVISVEKRINDNEYVKVDLSESELNEIKNILNNVSWEDVKFQMSRQPEYKVNDIYSIWLTSDMNQAEIIILGQNKYSKLSVEDTSLLFSILHLL